jgi:catechol 2,3-dioxygenase-like lactoylglutathione lyase family enzyme
MSALERIGRILVPVANLDDAIIFYTGTLGCTLVADMPFGEDSRWVEVAMPSGDTTIALIPPQDEFTFPRSTGIGFSSADARATHAALRDAGVDVDEIIGGDGGVPLLFFFRDADQNQFFVSQTTAR